MPLAAGHDGDGMILVADANMGDAAAHLASADYTDLLNHHGPQFLEMFCLSNSSASSGSAENKSATKPKSAI